MTEPTAVSTRALPWALSAFVFGMLTLTGGYNPITGDAQQMCDAAEHVLVHGSPRLQGELRGDVVRGPDGNAYTKYPLGAVLECIPTALLERAGVSLGGRDSPLQRFCMNLVPALYATLGVLGFFLLALQLGFSERLATTGALLLLFTTPLWHYARSMYTENLQATTLTWSLLVFMRARGRSQPGLLLAGGALLGLAINLKILLVSLPLAVLVDRGFDGWDRKLWTRFLLFTGLGALPGLVGFLAYNKLRYGSALTPGYTIGRDADIGFHGPLLEGLFGLLLSPGKSIFLYAPLLLTMGLGCGVLRRERLRDLVLLGLPTGFFFLAVAKWWCWSGDVAWGPRLVVPVVPALFVPVLWSLRDAGRVRRAAVLLLAALGLYVAIVGISVRPFHYVTAAHAVNAMAAGPNPPERVRDDLVPMHFVPSLSPLVGHGWLLWRYLRHEPWNEDSFYPWRSSMIKAWRPTNDPTPDHLNFWFGHGPSYPVLIFDLLCTVIAAVWLSKCLRRARTG